MTKYYASHAATRQAAHDQIDTTFSGGHADDLDSSSTSLHLDDGNPSLKEEDGEIWIYHGTSRQNRLDKLSDIPTDDRIFTPSGHIILSATVVQFYKAFARALDDKVFRLKGKFDCANAYIKTDISKTQFSDLPEVEADTWCPYYYRHSSKLKGNLLYDNILPAAPADPPHRRVSCINVKQAGDLSELLPNGHVVYLGGEHGERDLPPHQSPSRAPNPHAKYVQYKPHVPLLGPGAVDEADLYISSPFPQTWRATDRGLNVGLAVLRTGHFLYWATDCSPSPGNQISLLPFHEIPTDSFRDQAGVLLKSWPIYVDDEVVHQYDVFQGAWVMRGTHLVQDVNVQDYPAGVLDRLRGGFFRTCSREVVPSFDRILSRLLKAKQSVQRHGGKMFGFNDKPGGIVECDIQSLATYLRLPVDALLAFIPVYGSSFQLFRGTVHFLCLEEMIGVFQITKPLPTGPWMRGQLFDTGTGLLYSRSNKKYFSVTGREGVSWVTEYTGPGLSIRKDLVIAPFIAGVYRT